MESKYQEVDFIEDAKTSGWWKTEDNYKSCVIEDRVAVDFNSNNGKFSYYLLDNPNKLWDNVSREVIKKELNQIKFLKTKLGRIMYGRK